MMLREQRNSSDFLKKTPRDLRAQAILEFTFATVVFIMLALGMTKIMTWVYKTVAAPRQVHEGCIVGKKYTGSCSGGAVDRINAETRF